MKNAPMGHVDQQDQIDLVRLFIASEASSLLTGSIIIGDAGNIC